MELAERPEEVSVTGGGIRNARVSEQQREHGSECGPQDHQREHRRDAGAVDLLHENRHDEIRLRVHISGNEAAPRHNADDREIDADVDHRDRHGAHQNRPRDHPAGILHLVADVADIVVAEVVVNANARRGAKSEQKP